MTDGVGDQAGEDSRKKQGTLVAWIDKVPLKGTIPSPELKGEEAG